jgi:hypothetical protein
LGKPNGKKEHPERMFFFITPLEITKKRNTIPLDDWRLHTPSVVSRLAKERGAVSRHLIL